jgi:hypothetical protein
VIDAAVQEPAPIAGDLLPAKKKNLGGRPTVLTAECEARILETLTSGCSLRDAAEHNGVNYSTLKNRQRADPAFAERLRRARVKFKVCTLQVLADAIRSGNTTAACWFLERAYPEEYGRQRLEITGADGGPVTLGADLRAAQKVRGNRVASQKVHEALGLAVEATKAPLALAGEVGRREE